ncbi:helix-turn-helix domain-containing protein [Gordonia sp. SID5947]|uniref:helix-turn-helix domain-containing protein n=1 Tax=Gordonia sp. SID5947 TaxID=2690315 RepID=UPI00136F6EA9|nr:helix-turn-helix transcriptional regulator [Gordonia sp. SID5947]MYR07460.1 helix-turn-helix domain-containing protein [Gordonia sp. SID5947]
MATRRVEIGPVGRTVAANVTRYRKRQGFTMRDLAEDLAQRRWPISASAISQIENGARRVDVDDLFALAIALDIPRTYC